jgi:hypothetical protein
MKRKPQSQPFKASKAWTAPACPATHTQRPNTKIKAKVTTKKRRYQYHQYPYPCPYPYHISISIPISSLSISISISISISVSISIHIHIHIHIHIAIAIAIARKTHTRQSQEPFHLGQLLGGEETYPRNISQEGSLEEDLVFVLEHPRKMNLTRTMMALACLLREPTRQRDNSRDKRR